MKERKRYSRILRGQVEFAWFTLEQAEVATGKGGWYPAPEPKKQEEEIQDLEIDNEGQPEKPKRGRKPKQ
jgi:hypothetical protein